MMYPRALALAEIAWSPQEKREWEDFKPRMNAHIGKLQQMGINTFTLSDELEVTMKVDTVNKQIEVFLDAEKYPAEIRYTTDGTVPTASSFLYDGMIMVKDSAYIKAAIFKMESYKVLRPKRKSIIIAVSTNSYIIIVSYIPAIWPAA